MVIVNHNRKTGVVVRHGHKFTHVVLMASGKIAVKRLTETQFYEWKELPGQSTVDVANALLETGRRFKITKDAETALLNIIQNRKED